MLIQRRWHEGHHVHVGHLLWHLLWHPWCMTLCRDRRQHWRRRRWRGGNLRLWCTFALPFVCDIGRGPWTTSPWTRLTIGCLLLPLVILLARSRSSLLLALLSLFLVRLCPCRTALVGCGYSTIFPGVATKVAVPGIRRFHFAALTAEPAGSCRRGHCAHNSAKESSVPRVMGLQPPVNHTQLLRTEGYFAYFVKVPGSSGQGTPSARRPSLRIACRRPWPRG